MTEAIPKEVNIERINEAYEIIKDKIHKTPLLTSISLNKVASEMSQIPDIELFFKCENFQKCGVFKARGALFSISQLTEEQKKKGVITHSSGNHAAALAFGSRNENLPPAMLVMPKTAPEVKKSAVKSYGGIVVECEPTLQAREATCNKLQSETGRVFIHPYDNVNVICGQGTISLEIKKQLEEDMGRNFEDLDCVLLPCGGGGLISGNAVAIKSMSKTIKVFGGEPLNASDAYQSKKSGVLQHHATKPNSCADGLLTELAEKTTWPIVKNLVDDIFTVTEDEIKHAQMLVMQRLKIVIEPSSAVPFAVVLFNKDFQKLNMKKIAVVFSGGNIQLPIV